MTVQGGIVEYAGPGDHLTVTAGGAITGGQMVKLTGNRTVIATAASAELSVLGVALYNAANGDTNLSVATEGTWPLTATGAIAAGDQLISVAAGNVSTLAPAAAATLADINNARAVIGKSLEAIVGAATGRCKLNLL